MLRLSNFYFQSSCGRILYNVNVTSRCVRKISEGNSATIFYNRFQDPEEALPYLVIRSNGDEKRITFLDPTYDNDDESVDWHDENYHPDDDEDQDA